MIKAIYLSVHAQWERDLSARDFFEFLVYAMGFFPQMFVGKWNQAQYRALIKEVERRLHAFLTEEVLHDFDHQPEWDDRNEEQEQEKKKKKKSSSKASNLGIQLRLFFSITSQRTVRSFKKMLLRIIEWVEKIIHLSAYLFKRSPVHESSDENRFKN